MAEMGNRWLSVDEISKYLGAMGKEFSTIGYGFLLEETLTLLVAARESDDAKAWGKPWKVE